MIFKIASLSLLTVTALALLSCGDLSIDHSGTVAGSKSITSADATIDTPATVVNINGAFTSAVTGTGSWGCSYVNPTTDTTKESATFASGIIISALTVAHGNLLTPTTYMNVVGASARLRMVGTPSGNMLVQLRSTSGTDPASTLLTSSNVLISSIPNTNANGNLMSFTFPSNLELMAGTSYALVLKPQTDATLDGANNFRWVYNSDSDCSGFSHSYVSSADSGSSWSAAAGPPHKSFFTLSAYTHAASGSVSWIVLGYPNATWNMSTFAMTENAAGYTGTVTYDFGAGSSSSVATYSQTGQTLAQVKAASNLTGTYFYVRANLTVASPYFDRASVTGGSITAQ